MRAPAAKIAVWGTRAEQVEAAAAGLRPHWEVVVMGPSVDRAHSHCAAHLLLADEGRLPPAWRSHERDNERLVVVGARFPELRADAWFACLPPPAVLVALFGQWLPPPPATARPRRKTDLIVGSSPAIQELRHLLDRLAGIQAPVLVIGESGTGKELVARALHYCGPRANKPFVPVNCAAIPESLFESLLFGHQRGAFTDAVTARMGLFEAADGGTLFLDEIAELPLSMQPKLLRVLETHEFTRLGSTEQHRADVRLVAATNRSLQEEVAKGRFRQDLYYRIKVYPVSLPPLRQRTEDIPELVAHHLSELTARERMPKPSVSSGALEKLLRHDWPGNVRELVNVLQYALLEASNGCIEAKHIPLSDDDREIRILPYRTAKDEFEARYYTQVLRAAGGNVTLAARLARKTRKEIYDSLRRHSLTARTFRESDDELPR